MSGDFIVGFPEETEADFQATLDLIEEVNYGYAFSFKYSTRPGTPAAERDQLPEDVKSERLTRLQALITRQQRAVQDAMVGREVGVLFEKPGRLPGQMVGKSDYLHAVHVADSVARVGEIARVEIIESGSNSLAGRIKAA
jgi:tRNA-2-methylthio-N6-dimethylallyladenosine synthase